MLRSMIQSIRLVPEQGELAGILALTNEKSPRPFGPGLDNNGGCGGAQPP
jgi:hypothetical protein